VFWEIHFNPHICIFLGAGNFLANLRLFVREIFLRSRRAHRDCSKNTKVWKSHKIHINAIYTYKIPLNSSVLRNPLSSSYLYISWSWKFSGKSQIVCQRNFSEISQSPSCLYEKHKSLKTPESVHNKYECVQFCP